MTHVPATISGKSVATPPSFDVIRQSVQEIGRTVVSDHANDVDRAGRFPKESIAALREAALLSAYVPREFGGFGLSIVEIAKICETLGRYCGSTAMIYAMHCIQVASVVHHGQQSAYFRKYLERLVREQRLMASATTEIGTGGDLRSSICALETDGSRFALTKEAPVISYGEYAEDILVTCRRSPGAAPHEQALVLVGREDYVAKPLSNWDTLGFRGTCSSGFTLTAQGDVEQIVPVPFEQILSQSMHPFSHVVWGGLWTGIAADSVNKARAFVRNEARKTPGETPIAAIRLGEVEQLLQEMRNNVYGLAREYGDLLARETWEEAHGFGFAIRANNVKLSASKRIVEIVNGAMLICGIAGYRNDSKYSLSRHLRDAYGAAVMVNNDRVLKLNATMLLAYKEGH